MTIQEFTTAIQTQIASAAGLAGSKVIWEDPNALRPARPFLTLSILEDGDEEPLPEEAMIDNPDPDLDTFASADLTQVQSFPQIFGPGSVVTATVAGFEPGPEYQNWQILFDGQPALVYVPDASAVSWTPGQNATLTVHVQTGVTTGEDIAAGIAAFLAANPTVPLNISSSPLPAVLGLPSVISFSGGSIAQNPLLLQTTDRPEITVRVIAFTDAPKTGAISPAFALLKQVRRKMGTELTADTLDPITVLARGNVTNANVVLETGYEGRAVLDLKFGSIETESEGINTIETVKVEVTIKNLDGSTISDKTVTLPNS